VGDEGVGIGDDDAAVFEADERDEEADAAGDGDLQGVRDRGDDPLADAGDGEDKEDDAVYEDHAQGFGPRDAFAEDDGKGEEGVDAHAGGEGDGVVGEERHDRGRDGGGEGGDGDECAFVHAGRGENRGVDGEDVGHRGEGGETGLEFASDGGAVLGEAEEALEHGVRFSDLWSRDTRENRER
jgi:AAA ATPase containing von Willebrand factor type A (vWA) domain